MIHHLSIPARNPSAVAKVLAELLNGFLTKFGPNPDSYIAWAGDEVGTAIEVYPFGTEMLPGSENGKAKFQKNHQTSSYSATHVAVSVSWDTDEVLEIARREQWRAIEMPRGDFRVIEFWVENEFLIEIMTQEMVREYYDSTSRFRIRAQKET